MIPEINLSLANLHADELRREADAYRRAREAAGGRPHRSWRLFARRPRPVCRPA
ncbi:hypothetical protein [Actinoplanes awajinensis]|uniref:hypothetical protein n=1 Tax=Actinoplanes awajinensis TaxID=135946 RepID=UPI000AF42BAA|nr:hypothetical protein [Actinoplanes awajinensis]